MSTEYEIFEAVIRVVGEKIRRHDDARPVALLDWDHTVITNDSEEIVLHEMVRRDMPWARGRCKRYYDLLEQNRVEEAYRVGAKLFAGMAVAEAEAFVSSVMAAERTLPGGLEEKLGDGSQNVVRGIEVRQSMRRLIRWLNDTGIEVWLVTASPEILVRPAARDFGLQIEQVVGNQSLVRDGIITDELVEPVCMFKGKEICVEARLQGAEPVLVMGDSPNDEGMIRRFGQSGGKGKAIEAIVDRGRSFTEVARREGWHILKG